jgi:hypothetical protein
MRGDEQLEEFAMLVEASKILSTCALTYKLALRDGALVQTIELTADVGPQRDFLSEQMNAEALRHAVRDDVVRLIDACKRVPIRAGSAGVDFARRVRAACRDIEVPPLNDDVRRRNLWMQKMKGSQLSAKVDGESLEINRGHLPVHDWQSRRIVVYGIVGREKSGFAITPVYSKTQPDELKGLHRLTVPEFPASIMLTARLDRLSHSRQPRWIEVRLGCDLLETRWICDVTAVHPADCDLAPAFPDTV